MLPFPPTSLWKSFSLAGCIPLGLVCLALFPGITGCAARQMGRSEARQILTRLPGTPMPKENIYVEGVTQVDDRHAVAEAKIHTAFKMEKKGDEWTVSEMRLDRNRWIRIEDLYGRLVASQIQQTQADLSFLALGLERFRIFNASYPEAKDMNELMDLLFPKHLSRMILQDAWANHFRYRREDATSYVILSAGPDGVLSTKDDIVLRSGS